jgi:hypothetical protein
MLRNTRAALRRYVLRRSPVDPFPIPEIPDGCLPVHTVVLDEPSPWACHRLERLKRLAGIQFIEYAWEAPRALCGVPVRVVYPTAFDVADGDACPECRGVAEVRSIDPGEYQRQLRDLEQERYREWRRLERRRVDEARQRALEDLDDFYPRRDRGLGNMPPGVDLHDPSTWTSQRPRHHDSAPQARDESA